MLTASRIRDGLDATSKPDGGADGANDDRADGDGASDDGDSDVEWAVAAIAWPRLELPA
ncbi:hypothetical protein [Bradyrhizobium sp. McL0615]|uniref:hypothetical protein n=1 Tax=Bradyrhizobium sp. McL0615 TaxID=3415673 RepID=UPI003CF5A5B8